MISFIHPLSRASSPQRLRLADKIDWLQARYRPSLFPVYQGPVAHKVRQADCCSTSAIGVADYSVSLFNPLVSAPEVLAVPGARQASFCGTRLISTRRFCARPLASRCWRQDDLRRSPAPQTALRHIAGIAHPVADRLGTLQGELLIGSIVADAVGMACHHDQPAGFGLNAQQRVHQQLCRTRFQRRFAGIEQRHAIEADRLRPLHNLLDDRTRRRGGAQSLIAASTKGISRPLIQPQPITQRLTPAQPVIQQAAVGTQTLLRLQLRRRRRAAEAVIHRQMIADAAHRRWLLIKEASIASARKRKPTPAARPASRIRRLTPWRCGSDDRRRSGSG